MTAMGQQPTEEELFQMISEVDEDMSGAIGVLYMLPLVGFRRFSSADVCGGQTLPSFSR